MITNISKLLILIILFFYFFVPSSYAQFLTSQPQRHIFSINTDHAIELAGYGVDTTSIDSIKVALNGPNLLLSTFAADFVAYRKMKEFIPDIRARYFSANNFSQDGFKYLGALYNLGAPDIRELLNGFVDSVHVQYVLKNKDIDTVDNGKKYFITYAVWCIGVLCELGDYSQFSRLIDFFDGTRPLYGGIKELNKFIGKVDQTSENILYAHLKSNVTNNNDSYNAIIGLGSFVDRSETFPILLNAALHDSSHQVRSRAEDILLKKFHDKREVFELVVNRLYNKDGKSGQHGQGAALYDLDSFNYLDVLIILKDASHNVSDQKIRQRIQDSFDYYEPPRPDKIITSMVMLDSLSSLVTQTNQLNWIGNSIFADQLQNYLVSAKSRLQIQDSTNCATFIKIFQTTINGEFKDTLNQTPNFVTVEGWKFLYYNAQYILDRLPKPPLPALVVGLRNSSGTKLLGGTLQYYDGAWKDAINNNDGTFSIDTKQKTLSLRMTYEYGSQQKNNVTVGSDTVVFQTVSAQVKLQNRLGNPIDTDTVQYYAGAWRTFGTTNNGIAMKELLPVNYTFRVTYAYGSNDKAQDLSINPIVTFQTVNTSVQLKNSSGNLIDQGIVQYYSGAWRDFGTTAGGVATKELLPNNYTFRMSYAYGSNDKAQNIGIDNTVNFSTVLTTVRVKNLQNNPIDNATVTYYSGAWRTFGTTVNGETTKELLPANVTFRAKSGTVQQDKVQNLTTNPVVEIQLPVNN
ncbi:MAG: hypothetical protein PHP42_09335 [Bacteroidota bacterium]|nr:hypothetical protein [Bacteroidota bacterium]